ncbi:hypothetical protein ACFQH3_02540 [Haladaptatus sp. GCM10025707]|uniref:DUF7308 domain-containing protein n=1 Tax=Haladaptatus sp. GCM10025707 TaxID=3252658 RepID=UPI003620FB00
MTIYYENGMVYEGWENEQAFKTSCYDGDGDGVEDESYLDIDLRSMDVTMEYESITNSDVIGGAEGVSLDASQTAAADARTVPTRNSATC